MVFRFLSGRTAPAVSAAAPAVSAAAPAVSAAAPAVSEVAPAVSEVAPAVSEVAPAVSEVAPEVSEVAPEVSEVAPEVSEAAPEVSEAAPEVLEAAPEVSEAAPEAPPMTSPDSPAVPSSPTHIESPQALSARTTNKFVFEQKLSSLHDSSHTLLMLGTSTAFKAQEDYVYGEIFSGLYNCLSDATIVDGPYQAGPFCENHESIPAHSVGLMLQRLSKQSLTHLNVGGHSRGAIGALIVANELDRIQKALNSISSDNIEEIKKAVLNSIHPQTKSILEVETASFTEEDWLALKQNIAGLELNLFLLDPVPGNHGSGLYHTYRWKDERICTDDSFEIPDIVKNCTVQYAQDERTHNFDSIGVKNKSESTRLTLDSLPGHHGTASGNITDRNPNDDKSSFMKFHKSLCELLKKTGRVDARHFDQCITEGIAPNNWENLPADFEQKILTLIETQFGSSFSQCINIHLIEAKGKAFVEEIYKRVRSHHNYVQKITSVKVVELFSSHEKLKYSEPPEPFGKFSEQYETLKQAMSLLATPEELEAYKLSLYTVLSYQKQSNCFSELRKSYYPVISVFSKDITVLGRQIRLGKNKGVLQDLIAMPHDDSPFVCNEHRDLVLKQHLLQQSKDMPSPPEDSIITLNIFKITSLIHSFVNISNDSQLRKGSTPATIKAPYIELLVSYITEMLTKKDAKSFGQLRDIVSHIEFLECIKKTLFTDAETITKPGSQIEELITKIFTASDGTSVTVKEHVKEELQRALMEASEKALANIYKQIKTSIDAINNDWEFIEKHESILTLEARTTFLATLLQNIKKVIKDIEFVKDIKLQLSINIRDTNLCMLRDLVESKFQKASVAYEEAKKIIDEEHQAIKDLQQLCNTQKIQLFSTESQKKSIEKQLNELKKTHQELIDQKATNDYLLKKKIYELESQLEEKVKELLAEKEAYAQTNTQLEEITAALLLEKEEHAQKIVQLEEQTIAIRVLEQRLEGLEVAERRQAELTAQVAELQRKTIAFHTPKEKQCLKAISELQDLIEKYNKHLGKENTSNQEKKSAITDLQAVLADQIKLPSEIIQNYQTKLNEKRVTLSKHQDSLGLRLVRDSLRILAFLLTGIGLYRSMRGYSSCFMKPSHGESFCNDSEKQLSHAVK